VTTVVATWQGSGWTEAGLARATLELFAVAQQLGGRITFVGLGEGAFAAASDAGRYGASEALALESGLGAGADAVLTVLDAVCRERSATSVVLPADPPGREVAARLSLRLSGVAINDVTMVTPGNPVVWSRPVFGGKAIAQVAARRSPVVVTARPRAFEPASPAGGGDIDVTWLEPPQTPVRVTSKCVLQPDNAGVRLEDAKVIVAGGRGLGSRELFDRLSELADLLGGTVGASLAAVDAGWVTPDRQVGLTGKVVSPELYVAVGLSGASQHVAGLASVKNLVALNSDAKAPIFRVANLGAVVDAREAVPGLIDEIRRLRGQ
jgi:electron transfer flavoprotein alpha subunit